MEKLPRCRDREKAERRTRQRRSESCFGVGQSDRRPAGAPDVADRSTGHGKEKSARQNSQEIESIHAVDTRFRADRSSAVIRLRSPSCRGVEMNGPRRNIDIAIIGLSCRMPGAASADEFWKNLCHGIESIRTFSDQELVAAGVDPSLVANPDYVKAAPILRDVEMFDAGFFGYSPKDASLMDPQQRLFLEVCWETFENAGYDPTDYPGKVGVIASAGGIVSTYLIAKMGHPDFPGQTASTTHINNERDFLSTRVSFKLNLKGPSYTLQSACSS